MNPERPSPSHSALCRQRRRRVAGELARPLTAVFAFALVALTARTADSQPASDFPPWAGEDAAIERALRQGEVLSLTPVGRGILQPFRVELQFEGARLAGLWKPIDEGIKRNIRESYKAEVAAYRLSRLLALDRVPPTVQRRIRNQTGSLQYWIEGAELFVDVQEDLPKGRHFLREMARMRVFDRLIDNPDRNSSNFLVDDAWRILYIDHSRALEFGAYGRSKRKVMPAIYERKLVAELRQLNLVELQADLDDLLPKYRLKAILKARNRILEHIEEQMADRGESIFYD